MHLFVCALVVLPIALLGARRVTWYRWEVLGVVLPLACWMLLMTQNWRPKSLANLGEILYIWLATVGVTLVRIAVGRHLPQRVAVIGAQVAILAITFAIYWFTPMLSE